MNNKVFRKEIELLFAQSRKMEFNLDVLYSSETHCRLLDSEQNRCMNFLFVKQPCDIIDYLSEVYVRILSNQIVLISNDLLHTSDGKKETKYGTTKQDLFLDSCANFIRCFYFDICELLRPSGFLHIYENFVPNVDYSAETFKILNKSYLEYCVKSLTSKYVYENIFTNS